MKRPRKMPLAKIRQLSGGGVQASFVRPCRSGFDIETAGQNSMSGTDKKIPVTALRRRTREFPPPRPVKNIKILQKIFFRMPHKTVIAVHAVIKHVLGAVAKLSRQFGHMAFTSFTNPRKILGNLGSGLSVRGTEIADNVLERPVGRRNGTANDIMVDIHRIAAGISVVIDADDTVLTRLLEVFPDQPFISARQRPPIRQKIGTQKEMFHSRLLPRFIHGTVIVRYGRNNAKIHRVGIFNLLPPRRQPVITVDVGCQLHIASDFNRLFGNAVPQPKIPVGFVDMEILIRQRRIQRNAGIASAETARVVLADVQILWRARILPIGYNLFNHTRIGHAKFPPSVRIRIAAFRRLGIRTGQIFRMRIPETLVPTDKSMSVFYLLTALYAVTKKEHPVLFTPFPGILHAQPELRRRTCVSFHYLGRTKVIPDFRLRKRRPICGPPPFFEMNRL